MATRNERRDPTKDYPYQVQPGDTLPDIAKKFGFKGNWKKIYFYEKNYEFRENNKNPNVLHPDTGEANAWSTIIIPPTNVKVHDANSNQQYKYEVNGSDRELRLVMVNLKGEPLSNYDYSFDVNGVANMGKTNNAGMIKEKYIGGPEEAKLTLWLDPSKPYEGASLQWTIRVDLNPVDIPSKSDSGARARLNNLGFLAGPVEKGKSPDPLVEATKSFQKKYITDGEANGILDEATCSKIKEIYGC